MKIVLDTNILRQDISLKGAKFRALRAYAEKTRSEVILPQLVREEIIGLFRREVKDQVKRLKSMQDEYERSAYWGKVDFLQHIGDPEKTVDRFKAALLETFSEGKEFQIPYKGDHLPEIVRRAIDRVKPVSEKGEELRDALIWVGLRDFLKSNNSREEVAFISMNTRDFSGTSKEELHPELLEELKGDKTQLSYFSSLDAFLKQHAEPVEFLDESWLQKALPIDDVAGQIMERLEDSPMLNRLVESRGMHYISDAEVTKWTFDLVDFFVLSADKSQKKVEVLTYLEGEWEIEFFGISFVEGTHRTGSKLRSQDEGISQVTVTVGADAICTIENQKLTTWTIENWSL